MIVNKELAISKGHQLSDLWETPAHIFIPLNNEFKFTLDPCCTTETAKCGVFFTPNEDGLSKSWRGQTVFCNPPYSRGNIDKWVRKCAIESTKEGTTVVGLLPVSTSAKWWHQYIVDCCEIRFIERRVKFVGAPYTAPFSSVIVIWGSQGIKSFKQSA